MSVELSAMYSGAYLSTRSDAVIVISAFLLGRLPNLPTSSDSADLDVRKNWTQSGNIIVYVGERMRDGIAWRRDRKSRRNIFTVAFENVNCRPMHKYFATFQFHDTNGKLLRATLSSYLRPGDQFPIASDVLQLQMLAARQATANLSNVASHRHPSSPPDWATHHSRLRFAMDSMGRKKIPSQLYLNPIAGRGVEQHNPQEIQPSTESHASTSKLQYQCESIVGPGHGDRPDLVLQTLTESSLQGRGSPYEDDRGGDRNRGRFLTERRATYLQPDLNDTSGESILDYHHSTPLGSTASPYPNPRDMNDAPCRGPSNTDELTLSSVSFQHALAPAPSEVMDMLAQPVPSTHALGLYVDTVSPSLCSAIVLQPSPGPMNTEDIDQPTSARGPSVVTNQYQQWAVAILSNHSNIHFGITDPFLDAFSRFLWELSARHCATTICFSAMQKSIIEFQGRPVSYTVLAVLQEEMDLSENFDPNRRWETSFRFHFVVDDALLEPPNISNWLNLQVSAKHFHDERSKSAIWTFGALSSCYQPVETATFKWLKQERLNVFTISGLRTAIDISSGDYNCPLSRSHQLRCRLTHAANAEVRTELLIEMHTEYLTSIQDDCEDWCIALFSALVKASDSPDGLDIIDVHRRYILESIKIEEDAFHKAGYQRCLHVCRMDPCYHHIPIFAELGERVEKAWFALTDHLKLQLGTVPSKQMRQLSREIGTVFYLCRHAYALLGPEGKILYHSVSFDRLNSARAHITASMSPAPALIWNYLPPDIKGWAQQRRVELRDLDI